MTAQRAELQFKEGFAASNWANEPSLLGLLGLGSETFPMKPRYRAY